MYLEPVEVIDVAPLVAIRVEARSSKGGRPRRGEGGVGREAQTIAALDDGVRRDVEVEVAAGGRVQAHLHYIVHAMVHYIVEVGAVWCGVEAERAQSLAALPPPGAPGGLR